MVSPENKKKKNTALIFGYVLFFAAIKITILVNPTHINKLSLSVLFNVLNINNLIMRRKKIAQCAVLVRKLAINRFFNRYSPSSQKRFSSIDRHSCALSRSSVELLALSCIAVVCSPRAFEPLLTLLNPFQSGSGTFFNMSNTVLL